MTADRRLSAAAMLIGLPVFAWYSWLCLTFFDGALVLPLAPPIREGLHQYLPRPTVAATLLYGSWLILQVALYFVVPGRSAIGMPLSDGSRLEYRMNGLLSFVCTIGIVLVAVWSGWVRGSIAYDEFGPLLVTANIAAFAMAAVVFVSERERSTDAREKGGLVGYVFGASLNPRIGDLDLKFFCEARPGLMLWVLLDASCAAKQYELHGFVTTPMLLVNAFQLLYVADYFVHEDAILTTWDIRHERFGWMLCWGCLVWVPFMYSIQAYYLATHTHSLSLAATTAIVLLNLIGYTIFRGANIQKHRFRTDPARRIWGQPPAFIRTRTGALLLTSGWWGIARHANYFGDLLMALAWCLPTGTAHPLTYFYVVYFFILLLHRERRDHRLCLARYGQDWETYCQRVQWRIVPGLY